MIKKEQFILSGSKDKTISGDLTYDDKHTNQPCILFVHGFKGFKDWGAHNLVASFFATRGYRYFKFNLSHSGVTAQRPDDVTDLYAFAENTVSMELKDVDTALNYIAHTYPATPIYLIGHSRGGALVVLKGMADERIHKIITWSAIADFSSLWKKEQEEEWITSGRIFVENARTKEKMPLNSTLLEDFKAHREEFDILHAAAKVKIPWLILHGDDDVNVKFSVAQQLAQAQPRAQLQKIKGGNHVYGANHPYTEKELPAQLLEVCEKSLSFLKSPDL
ncbi:pimeloyl-ACP methyl ester carboxylesterase [Pedobacter cryoconitis]|uniref:Pimeloyl-ACP methyl ester carboxylesterase n=1 Tax=Pedobacter cryoconitis TaxID=188932 RepID=A0A7W8ZR05_9SPHI|nr:alpha/beta hydrolase [Pedobacter cryoconitis]MBB5638592.1 pimeloyl-ACP methyl ester carboxylesterase [Pedobacter cryoconitis]